MVLELFVVWQLCSIPLRLVVHGTVIIIAEQVWLFLYGRGRYFKFNTSPKSDINIRVHANDSENSYVQVSVGQAVGFLKAHSSFRAYTHSQLRCAT